jgi:hypothetical protein
MILFMSTDNSGFNWLTDNGTPYAAYDMKNAADWDESKEDLTGQGRDIADRASLPSSIWTAGVGWTMNGSSHYALMDYGLDSDWTVAIKFNSSSGASSDYLFGAGVSGGAPFYQVRPHDSTNDMLFQYGDGDNAEWDRGTDIVEGIITCTGPNLYFDGDYKDTSSSSFTGGPTDDFILGARRTTIASGHWAGVIEAMIVFDKELDASEVDTLYQGMLLL